MTTKEAIADVIRDTKRGGSCACCFRSFPTETEKVLAAEIDRLQQDCDRCTEIIRKMETKNPNDP